MAAAIRVFVAHGRALNDSALEDMAAAIGTTLRGMNPGVDIAVTLGRDDFNAKYPPGGPKAVGGAWDAWAKSIAAEADPITKQPRFHFVVLPAPEEADCQFSIGKVTAQILQAMEQRGRSGHVMVWLPGRRAFVKVQDVQTTDSNNFKAGWQVIY